jgi:hypothetical protein
MALLSSRVAPTLPPISPRIIRLGAPRFLATITPPNFIDNVLEVSIIDSTGGVLKRINPQAQIDVFYDTVNTPRSRSPWIYTITGRLYPRRAQILTASLISNREQNIVWHTLRGTLRDNLRDRECNENIDMIVIDGFNNESSRVKFEKAYDILEMYNDIPRIVIGSGCDPMELMRQAHLPANRILYLDDTVPIQEI